MRTLEVESNSISAGTEGDAPFIFLALTLVVGKNGIVEPAWLLTTGKISVGAASKGLIDSVLQHCS